MKIKQTVISNYPIEDLGIELEQVFNYNSELDREFKVIHEGETNDGTPVLISKLIEILELMKSEGCNYVQIDTSRYDGYEIHGSKIESFTESELEQLKEKERQEEIKQLNLQKVLMENRLSKVIERMENI